MWEFGNVLCDVLPRNLAPEHQVLHAEIKAADPASPWTIEQLEHFFDRESAANLHLIHEARARAGAAKRALEAITRPGWGRYLYAEAKIDRRLAQERAEQEQQRHIDAIRPEAVAAAQHREATARARHAAAKVDRRREAERRAAERAAAERARLAAWPTKANRAVGVPV